MKSVELRLARLEGEMASLICKRSELIERAYKSACREGNAERAGELARMLRDSLLEASDSKMLCDRVGLNFGSISELLASIGNISKSKWAVYRKELRDLPEQPGFPFDVKFPEVPSDD
jgi:hypothetical protein